MRLSPQQLQELRPIGWSDRPEWLKLIEQLPGDAIARVIGQHRNAYQISTGDEAGFRAQPPAPWTRPRFAAQDRACVGDWVHIDREKGQILGLLPRFSLLKRGGAGEHYQQQPIAANIDTVFVVTGLDGDFNPRRVERYVLLVQASGANPILVFTKLDQVGDEMNAALQKLRAHWLQRDVSVLALNAKDEQAAQMLMAGLQPGMTAVLVGSSGAGKSTLSNALLGRQALKTAAVRQSDSRGRHTTTSRYLFSLPNQACLIDTPGMRELKLIGDELLDDKVFDDIDALAADCRFRDCVHASEPGCAVQAAIESGELELDRFRSYCKLRDERDARAVSLQERKAEAAAKPKPHPPRSRDKFGNQ